MLAEGLRYLLPEYREPADPRDATPEPVSAAKEEAPREPDETESKVLAIITTLDKDGKGAPWEGILEAAVSKSVAKDALEESINSLLDKGLIYEPILGRMKKI
jgi:DNA replicative helicase MCM subunit Mcm2 (Cdc46/Mcm family)